MSLITVSVSDTLTLRDWQSTVSNTLSLADSVAINLSNIPVISVNVFDVLSLSDALSLAVGLGVSATDSITLSDNLSATTPNLFVLINDFINFVDSIQRFTQYFLTFSDTITFTDAIQVLLSSTSALTLSISDSITLVDAVILSLGLLSQSVSISDSIILTDDIQLYLSAIDKILITDVLVFIDDVQIDLRESFNTYMRKYLNDFTP